MPFLSSTPQRRVLLAAIVVVGLALAALVAGPLRGTRADIAQQKRDVHAQLGHVKAQRSARAKQLEITSRQLDIAMEQLKLARDQHRISEQVLAMQRRLMETLDIQRRLLEIAEQTLREAKEVNRKIPPPS